MSKVWFQFHNGLRVGKVLKKYVSKYKKSLIKAPSNSICHFMESGFTGKIENKYYHPPRN
jgi:hypothetical protein